MFGLFLIVITLIICASILFGKYMGYCDSNNIGMFENPKYEERIRNLEKTVNELKEK